MNLINNFAQGYKANLSLLQNPTNAKLCGIIAAVGLAQNFAALRALSVTGIQRGHMGLHALNIAMAAGAPDAVIPYLIYVCTWLAADAFRSVLL